MRLMYIKLGRTLEYTTSG